MTEETGSDVLSLRGESLAGLLRAVAADAPGRQALIAGLAADQAVRLIRVGSRGELAEAVDALSRFIASPKGKALAAQAPAVFGDLAGLLPPLSAATSPAGLGGEQLALREWKGQARRAVQLVADAPDQQIERSALRARLEVSESYLSHLLLDLEAAGLVERISRPGRKSVIVHLGPRGRQLVDEGEFRPAHVDADRRIRGRHRGHETAGSLRPGLSERLRPLDDGRPPAHLLVGRR